MNDKLKVSPEVNVRDAISQLVMGGKKTLFVTDKKGTLIGLFTNGDMRRFLLTDSDLSQPISEAMNPHPRVFTSMAAAEAAKKTEELIVYPVIDDNRILQAALYAEETTLLGEATNELRNVPLVIIAGGKGTRLYPYTKVLPKALIPIGDCTVTERIIGNFTRHGCRRVYMVLNHKAAMIRAYFNEIDRDYEVDYVQEERFLGTGGGLYLLREKLDTTFFVSNCDILIQDDLSCAYKTHKQNGNIMTFVCSMKGFQIPYGIIKTNAAGSIISMEEKPQFDFLVNTGVYIMEPDALDLMEDDEFIHIPDLARRCLDKGLKVGVFPVSEKAWLDMGQFDSMEIMLKELQTSQEAPSI